MITFLMIVLLLAGLVIAILGTGGVLLFVFGDVIIGIAIIVTIIKHFRNK